MEEPEEEPEEKSEEEPEEGLKEGVEDVSYFTFVFDTGSRGSGSESSRTI